MTIRDLIKELKKHDKNLEVRVEYDGDYRPLRGVEVGRLYAGDGRIIGCLSRSGDNLVGDFALLLM